MALRNRDETRKHDAGSQIEDNPYHSGGPGYGAKENSV